MQNGDKLMGCAVLERFFEMANHDPVIDAGHIALFMALYTIWQSSGSTSPFTITSAVVLPLAKISSRTTYHSKMSDLAERGYIGYQASYYGKTGSKVFIENRRLGNYDNNKDHGREKEVAEKEERPADHRRLGGL
ncbi:hypothetical protein [Sphingobacterium sp. MYb388]|uniref:hypothetical protein n=1 Tax=Sphingobacterium sp. MYb388 TaxID=2745437 RepID=UPI0030ADCD40